MKTKSLIVAVVSVLFLYAIAFAQSQLIGSVIKDANLRAGPGTTYAIAGALKPGQPVTIIGKNPAGDWYHLSDGHWVFSALVKVFGTATPSATVTPTITGTRPTSTSTAIVTKTPTITPMATITATPTPTSGPLSALRDAVATAESICSGWCKFSEVEFDTDGDGQGKVIVRFIDKAPSSIWSNDDFNRDTGLKIFYTLKAINEIDVDYDAIAFEFGVPVIDKYGNESVELGISCLFTKETVKRINYPNIRMRHIVDLADRAYINPVLKQN